MNTYKRYRFPPDIIYYAVWLYYRFNLRHRDIEDLLAERGIIVTREVHIHHLAILIHGSPKMMLLAVDLDARLHRCRKCRRNRGACASSDLLHK
jgi:hypothetical protein